MIALHPENGHDGPCSIGFCPICLSGTIDVLSFLLGSDLASK